jgi:hypothetical protein
MFERALREAADYHRALTAGKISVVATNDGEVMERLIGRGFHVAAASPEDFASFLRQEPEVAGRLVREAGIKPE